MHVFSSKIFFQFIHFVFIYSIMIMTNNKFVHLSIFLYKNPIVLFFEFQIKKYTNIVFSFLLLEINFIIEREGDILYSKIH